MFRVIASRQLRVKAVGVASRTPSVAVRYQSKIKHDLDEANRKAGQRLAEDIEDAQRAGHKIEADAKQKGAELKHDMEATAGRISATDQASLDQFQ